MDLAYDHIQENAYSKEETDESSSKQGPQPSLNNEIQDAYKAFSASPWGARIGGFLGNVVKQARRFTRLDVPLLTSYVLGWFGV